LLLTINKAQKQSLQVCDLNLKMNASPIGNYIIHTPKSVMYVIFMLMQKTDKQKM